MSTFPVLVGCYNLGKMLQLQDSTEYDPSSSPLCFPLLGQVPEIRAHHTRDGRTRRRRRVGINSGFITGIVTRKHPLRIQSRVPPLNRGLGCVSQRGLLRYLVLGHLWLHQMPRAPWTPCLCSTRVDSENQIRTMSVSRIDLQFACHRLLPPSHLGW